MPLFANAVSSTLAPGSAVRFVPATTAIGTIGLGTSVAWVGDTDGDRLGEFAFGAPFDDGPRFADAGYASIIRGRATWESGVGFLGGTSNVLVASPDAVANPSRYALVSEVGLALTGFSVAGAGDVNGDGRADVVVGVAGYTVGTAFLAGTATLLPGVAAFPSLNATLPPLGARGTTLTGVQAPGDQAGFAVSGPGDVNGDGFADVLIGLPNADPLGRNSAGAAVLVMGMAGATLDITAAGGAVNFTRFLGAAASDNTGLALSGVGDLNGDGLADFALAAPNADPLGRSSAGSVYVVFGRAGGWTGDVDLAVPGDWGFRVDGVKAISLLGTAVSAAGDVNGDGFGDLLLGAPLETDADGNQVGAAYLLFGAAGLANSANVDLAANPSGRWVALRGGSEGDPALGYFDGAGGALSGAGDVNGDGFADFAVGAPSAGGGRGSVFIVYGRDGSWTDLNLRSLTADQGERIDGVDSTFGGFGSALAINGDGNADGRSDLLVGAPFQGANGNRPGEAWLVFSQGAAGAPVTLRGTTLADSLGGGGGNDVLTGFGGRDVLVGRGGGDTLSGGDGNDTLFGDEGDDVLLGGAGDNLLDGGGGRDLANYADFAFALIANLNSGQVLSSPIAFTVDRLVAVEDWTGGSGDDIAFGTGLANVLSGGEGDDALHGLAGMDTLFGGEGADRLQGGAGNDTLVGGEGSDVYAISDLGDLVSELAGEAGQDQALVLINGWAVSANIELISLIGDASRITGSAAGDTMAGNADRASSLDGAGGDDQLFSAAAFADTLRGGAGDDMLRGLGGGDTLIGGTGADQMVGAGGVRDVFLFDATGWAPSAATVAAAGYAGRAGDEIFGFVRGEDVLHFRPASGVTALSQFTSITPYAYDSVEGGVTVARTNVQIIARDGSVLNVYGLEGNVTLSASDFLFG